MKQLLLVPALLFMSFVAFAQKEVEGKIVSYKNKILVMKADHVDAALILPLKLDTCVVYKDISGGNNLLGFNLSSGYLGIGDAKFVSKKGNTFTFKVLKEKSQITVNGQKRNNFPKGQKIKVDWE